MFLNPLRTERAPSVKREKKQTGRKEKEASICTSAQSLRGLFLFTRQSPAR